TVDLFVGDDASLLTDALRARVDELVGEDDRSLVVEELSGDEYEVAALVDAAQTPPFLTAHRVVVARHAGRFSADELTPLVDYLDDPLPTTSLVLAWERGSQQQRLGAPPKKLKTRIEKSGGSIVDTGAGRGRARGKWAEDQMKGSALSLDAQARRLVAERLGDDVERVSALLRTLESAYGAGAKLGPDDVEPYLGEAGQIPPWDLTDAIDDGDIAASLERLARLTGAGDMHPLQVMAILQNHYKRILRLDGAMAADEKAAAQLLGIKGSTFPAKKALNQSRRLGHDRIVECISLLAKADLDLRGATAWDGELVLEVLVARLARLGRR
ncbi:MAG: DNA polymerase III subunit delta, partial [Actinomycetota bacterium]